MYQSIHLTITLQVEAHELARLNQEIQRVTKDYNDFTTILESTTRSVAFLDRKVIDSCWVIDSDRLVWG